MRRVEYRYLGILLLAAALLTGCAGGATAPTTSAPLPTEAVPSPQPMAGATVFRIVAPESQARFRIDETLAGTPNTVEGITSQVAGEIQVLPSAPAQSQLGTITIDAGSLTTDNGLRNSAIRNFILQTDTYPTITFTPTSTDGLPASAAPGDNVTFTVAGDLTIRDVTLPVTFDVTVAVESSTRLTGLAHATIARSDFGLAIPSVPQVADVSDTIILELAFTAQA